MNPFLGLLFLCSSSFCNCICIYLTYLFSKPCHCSIKLNIFLTYPCNYLYSHPTFLPGHIFFPKKMLPFLAKPPQIMLYCYSSKQYNNTQIAGNGIPTRTQTQKTPTSSNLFLNEMIRLHFLVRLFQITYAIVFR